MSYVVYKPVCISALLQEFGVDQYADHMGVIMDILEQ